MITRLRYPKGYQFFDAKGAPLALGTLSYYVAGTTTLQDTYSDSAGTAVNTNPIALDSSGRLDVDVFLGSTANYKEVLASSSATVSPWPDDNIPLATQSWPVLISANTSYNIAASGGDYTSLASALSDLGNKFIGGSTWITLNIADGIYTSSSTINDLSNQFGRVIVQGNTYTKTISSVQSSSGAGGAWSVVLNLSDVSNVYVNGYVVVGRLTGGTAPYLLAGCHRVTNVDAVNNRITILSTSQWGSTASGAVTGSLYFMGATLLFNNCNGIDIYGGCAALNIQGGVAIVGNHNYGDGSSYIALDAEDEARLFFSGVNGINGFGYGLYTNYCSSAVGGTLLGVSNCPVMGTYADTNSVHQIGALAVSGCYYGVYANDGGTIRKSANDVVVGNGEDGVSAILGGIVEENTNAITSANVRYGVYKEKRGYVSVMNGALNSGNNTANGAMGSDGRAAFDNITVNQPAAVVTDTTPIAKHMIYASSARGLALVTTGTAQWTSFNFAESGGALRLGIQKEADNSLSIYTFAGAAGSESVTKRIGMDTSGNLTLSTGALKVGTNQVVGARVNGYGTPTNGAKQPSFDATTITLGNLAAAVAQLIADLKTHGLLGA